MIVKNINRNDVKIGGGNQKYPGNLRYTSLISSHKIQFVMAQNDKSKRNSIINNVYNQITTQCTPPGRFVAKNKDGSYTVKSKEDALVKIKKALSENNATVRAHLELRGKLPAPVRTKSNGTKQMNTLGQESNTQIKRERPITGIREEHGLLLLNLLEPRKKLIKKG